MLDNVSVENKVDINTFNTFRYCNKNKTYAREIKLKFRNENKHWHLNTQPLTPFVHVCHHKIARAN